MVDVAVEWILNISIILNTTARDSTAVSQLVVKILWPFFASVIMRRHRLM